MTSSSDSASQVHATYLCLLCRQNGHLFGECPYLTRRDGTDDDSESGIQWHLPAELDEARLSPAFSPPNQFSIVSSSHSSLLLCQRCQTLNADLPTLFTSSNPFTLSDKSSTHANRAKRKLRRTRTLGPIRTLQLHSTCPLCHLLFHITHLQFTAEEIRDVTSHPETELVIVPAWTINRVEREVRWRGYEKGDGPYARCVYVALKPAWEDWSWGATLVDRAMDALAFESAGGAFGVKRVDPQRVDYEVVRGWLARCGELHQEGCCPKWSEDLRKIKLVDVETRKIVAYPVGGCDYLALSYVWGGVVQPAYKLGDVLPPLPATIEDAMTVTRALGKGYLWVDSLCINQSDKEEKAIQIALMSAIYSGACATIFALSGHSAHSGLPRVSSFDSVIPQLVYETSHGNVRLLSLMPTLAQQLSHSPWVKRAWTYQEGMLSPRRLFFTNHQVYFECNAFQCCESLDETRSPFHLVSDGQRRIALEKLVEADIPKEYLFGRGLFRDPFRQLSTEKGDEDALLEYKKLVYVYTSKKMTNDEDSINAFSAILTRLQEHDYNHGFLCGLPIKDLPRALVWTHVKAAPRRRHEFPAWSWAGWEGAVKPILVKGARVVEKAKEPPLCVCREGDMGKPELVYEFNPVQWVRSEDSNTDDSDDWESESEDEEEEASTKTDPVFEIARIMQDENLLPPSNIGAQAILIEGLILQLQFHKTRPQSWPDSTKDHEPHDVDPNLSADSQQCTVRFPNSFRDHQLRIYGENAREVIDDRHGKLQDFLLLAREHDGPELWYAMLLIDWDSDDEGTAKRVAVASLGIDWFRPGLLNPRRRMFKLI